MLGIEAIGEINAPNTAVCMDLYPQCLDIVRSVSPLGKIREIELNLIPTFVKPHRHCTDERFHFSRALIV